MITDLHHIRYVTANFNGLQGLKLIPFGLFLWGEAALTYLGPQIPWIAESGILLRMALGALCLLLYWPITLYYRHSFGHVERLPANSGERVFWVMTWMLIGTGLLAYLLTAGGRGVIEHGRLATPLNVILLLISWLVALRFTTHRYTPSDVLSIFLGTGMAGVALLALLFEVTALVPFRAGPGALGFALLGGAAFLVGARHHRLLTQAFRAVPEEEKSDA